MSCSDTPKRPRGRPTGSGKKDDSFALKKLTRYLVDNPTERPFTSIPKACGDAFRADSPRRRLQRKWKQEGKRWMEVVAAERTPKPMQPAGVSLSSGERATLWTDAVPRAAQMVMDDLNRGAAFKAQIQAESQAFVKMAQDMASATTQAARFFEETTATRALLAAVESPVMKAMRDWEESPVQRMMREIQNSPALQAVREWERIAKAAKPWI